MLVLCARVHTGPALAPPRAREIADSALLIGCEAVNPSSLFRIFSRTGFLRKPVRLKMRPLCREEWE